MFDFQTEETIPISQLPILLPSRPHISTVWRWIKRGCRGVHLETILIGGKHFTSKEALKRFVDATSRDGGVVDSGHRSDTTMCHANLELDEAGL
ncbi:MAG: DUF1580 domain-containing protein [Planctomycetales bacterium]|nr:DUF1580 domain-containing protein [Planctomycetales bacterium]